MAKSKKNKIVFVFLCVRRVVEAVEDFYGNEAM